MQISGEGPVGLYARLVMVESSPKFSIESRVDARADDLHPSGTWLDYVVTLTEPIYPSRLKTVEEHPAP